MRPGAPAPFIVGVPRSGTTLARLALDAHPQMAIPPETGFLLARGPRLAAALRSRRLFASALAHHPVRSPVWRDFNLEQAELVRALGDCDRFDLAEGLRTFYRLYAEGQGKPRWGDKTPSYLGSMDRIAKVLPEARFIHVIRDGRDVAASLRRQWFAPSRDIADLARHWSVSIRRARAVRLNVLEVRFEDLVGDFDRVLASMCEFVDLPFVAGLDDPPRRAARLADHRSVDRRVGRVVLTREQRARQQVSTAGKLDATKIGGWRTQLTEAENAAFESVAGDLLRELGY